jgi:hypothetical protein
MIGNAGLARRTFKIASLVGIEGGVALNDDISLIEQYRRLHVRYMTLTWRGNLSWAGSSQSEDPSMGLTPLGRKIVQEMNRVGMLIVTRGAEGASLISRHRRVDIPVAAPDVLRDPTGVGDAFRAGLIVGLVRGYPWEVTGRIGALAATYCLEHSGTMNHRYTVPEFVARYRATFGDEPALQDLVKSRRGGSSE